MYGNGAMTFAEKSAMANSGVFTFHTCTSDTYIPRVYLENITREIIAHHPDPSPQRLLEAIQIEVDHWFLIQILNAISHHSIV